MTAIRLMSGLVLLAAALPLRAEDAEGCKDHPLFNRMPDYHLASCESNQFDARRFPVGAAKPDAEGYPRPGAVEVEGPYTYLVYQIREGAKPPSPLQVRRNFEGAAKRGGGSVEGTWPGWCEAYVDESLSTGNACIFDGITVKFARGGREVWAFIESEDEGSYVMHIIEREAMKQDIVANELLDKINKDGFVALYINFDTGKATIKPDSAKTLDDVAAALKSAPDLKLEVAGHTDNVGGEQANLKLSEERAKAVVAALTQRGIAAARLTPKGYGQSAPVADNRSEDGRARNRRVELVKK